MSRPRCPVPPVMRIRMLAPSFVRSARRRASSTRTGPGNGSGSGRAAVPAPDRRRVWPRPPARRPAAGPARSGPGPGDRPARWCRSTSAPDSSSTAHPDQTPSSPSPGASATGRCRHRTRSSPTRCPQAQATSHLVDHGTCWKNKCCRPPCTRPPTGSLSHPDGAVTCTRGPDSTLTTIAVLPLLSTQGIMLRRQ